MSNLKKYALYFAGILLVAGITLVGITIFQNKLAKQWGGTVTIKLPANEKLQTVTWKDDHLWHLTRPMRANEEAEEYKFKEDSAFGVLQGTVILKETKSMPTAK